MNTVHHVDEVVAKFDEALVSAMDVSSRMKPNLSSDHHLIPEDVSLLALGKKTGRRSCLPLPAIAGPFGQLTGKLKGNPSF